MQVSLLPRTTRFTVPGTAAHTAVSGMGPTALAVYNLLVECGGPEPSTNYLLFFSVSIDTYLTNWQNMRKLGTGIES